MANGEIRVNQKLMQQVLDCFSTFTGVRATFDCGEDILYGNNQKLSPFCEELRKIECYQRRCLKCDWIAKENTEKCKDIYIYKCHMGFWEAIVPVTVRNEIVSYLTIGQIVDADRKDDIYCHIEKVFQRDKIPEETQKEIIQHFQSQRMLTYKEFKAGVKLLKIMGDYLSHNRVIELYYRTVVETVSDYLERNYANEITSSEIEKITQYRYSYVCDIFKQQTGGTIKRFLEEVRLKRATELLRSTSLKIYEISECCGYRNSYYFNRVFKRKYLCTPQEYRQNFNRYIQ